MGGEGRESRRGPGAVEELSGGKLVSGASGVGCQMIRPRHRGMRKAERTTKEREGPGKWLEVGGGADPPCPVETWSSVLKVKVTGILNRDVSGTISAILASVGAPCTWERLRPDRGRGSKSTVVLPGSMCTCFLVCC